VARLPNVTEVLWTYVFRWGVQTGCWEDDDRHRGSGATSRGTYGSRRPCRPSVAVDRVRRIFIVTERQTPGSDDR
jgi:hypothetical protein